MTSTPSTIGTAQYPVRVAIVGSGPSGFYAAEPLLKSTEPLCVVDMFERLPTPYGLVRGGVAPDHPKIRTVVRVYEQLAQHERFRFLGNVHVGRDVSIEELRRYYDAVIFAYGAETDRRLGVPGEDLPGSYTATSFVAWYNGHPDYADAVFDLSQETAVIIGVGNVALDVARILAKTPDELKQTDIAAHALEALGTSCVKNIYVVGRRGPAQAAFTPLELKELGELAACEPIVDPNDLNLDEASQAETAADRNAARNVEILREFAARTPSPDKPRRLYLKFLLSPVSILGETHVTGIRLERNRLEGTPGNLKARGTGETIEIPCGLVFRSIGYKGIPMPGVPFDERRGIIPNREGRVLSDDAVVPGLYVVGWIKRGPSGIIGTNKPDSLETVKHLLEDVPHLSPCPERNTDALCALLRARGIRVVSFADWKKIDAAEQARGQALGKPREKFVRVEEMLHILDESA